MEQQLGQAAKNGDIAQVRQLIAAGVNPAAMDNWAIQLASLNGHTEVVRLLLSDPRVNPAANNNNAIIWASRNGHLGVVRLLLQDKRMDLSTITDGFINMVKGFTTPAVVEVLEQYKTGS